MSTNVLHIFTVGDIDVQSLAGKKANHGFAQLDVGRV